MFRLQLRLALRRLGRNRLHTLLNVLGLSLGLAASLLILRFVQHELSYDRHHERAERIVRFGQDLASGDDDTATARSGQHAAPLLMRDFPDEVEAATALAFRHQLLLKRGDRGFHDATAAEVDSNLFRVFTIPLRRGDRASALRRPGTTIISPAVAASLFGDERAIGKKIDLAGGEELEVTGVFEPPAGPQHFSADLFVSTVGDTVPGHPANAWFLMRFHTYALLKPEVKLESFRAQMQPFVDRHAAPWVEQYGNAITPHLTPLLELHLHSDLLGEAGAPGDAGQVTLFFAIALLIVAIAVINFINLATAHSLKRAGEVGMHKVVGASRAELVGQFATESLLLVTVAGLLSLLLARLLLPLFNRLAGLNLELELLGNTPLLTGLAALFALIALTTALAPALLFSSFKPVTVLKGQLRQGRGTGRLRKLLVIFQFTTTVALIASTLVVLRQMHYLQSRDLGFEHENVLIVPLKGQRIQQQLPVIKQRLLDHSAIKAVAASSITPGTAHGLRLFAPEGRPDDDVWRAGLMTIDHDYFDLYRIRFAEGRGFDRARPSDSTAWVINQSAALALGWAEPLGKVMDFPARPVAPGPVIGVIADYHHQSLHGAVQPMVFRLDMGYKSSLSLRLQPGQSPAALREMEAIWEEHAPEHAFDYSFLNDKLAQQYSAERHFGELFSALALLAVLIACFGLLGLAAHAAERRTAEIGLRKVLGASTGSLVGMLVKEYLGLVLVASLIGLPLAVLLMQRWLGSFAYHTGVGLWPLLASAALALLIALLTVSGHALRASKLNPVQALRVD